MIQSLFAYHMVPNKMCGNILMPLNMLGVRYPEAYQFEVAKYKGREELLKAKVHGLNCLWNDVLMFSPVHPRDIRAAMNKAGHVRDSVSWFQVPLSLIKAELAVFYSAPSEKPKNLSDTRPEDFKPYTVEQFSKFCKITQQSSDYFRSIPKGGTVFPFQFIPHLLVKDVFEIDDLEIIIA